MDNSKGRYWDKPILFSGPMVRAILAGTKTSTRRVIKAKAFLEWVDAGFTDDFIKDSANRMEDLAPYQPGMKLWVRETSYAPPKPRKDCLGYVATDDDIPHGQPYRIVPSIFMERRASRITLDVTAVRAERLQEITEEDAIREGLTGITKDGKLVKYGIPDRDGLPGTDNTGWAWEDWCVNPIDAFARLWDSINGKTYPWASNPFCWVIEFRRI